MSTDITIQKPKKVSFAINLLIVSIVLGVVNLIIDKVTPDFPELIPEMKNYSNDPHLFVIILSFALTIFFAYQMNQRKKWARTTFLVTVIISAFFVILGALTFPSTIITMFKSNPAVGLISIILNTLQLISLVMMYSKTANEWFNFKRNLLTTGA
ncbi:MAG: hypothetical protein WC833_00390 [Bacteroidales bacterium]|jgi:hypothetical protein